ncbi:hypothetical protein FQN57_006260 [Myotisia sp. PD_48]|nr:hypothetical protein FQN57_006260 [Myotisia sp. PD_48]
MGNLSKLPSEVLHHIIEYVLWDDDDWWLSVPGQRRFMNLRLINKLFNHVTITCAFSSAMDLSLIRPPDLNRLPYQLISRLICEKLRIKGYCGALGSLFSKLEDTLSGLVADKIIPDRDPLTFIRSFAGATITFLGPRDTIEHILTRNIPSEALFFGSRLEEYDFILLVAAWEGDVQLGLDLLSNVKIGGPKESRNKIFIVALYLAAYRNHSDLLRLIIDHGSPPIDSEVGYLGNALRAAVCGNSPDTIDILLQHDADLHFQGCFTGGPLQAAAKLGHLDIVRMLLRAGADPITYDSNHESPLISAALASTATAQAMSADIIPLFLGVDGPEKYAFYSDKVRALCAACHTGNEPAIRLLLEYGVDPNDTRSCDPDAYSAHVRALTGDSDLNIIKLLLEHGSKEKPFHSVHLIEVAILRNKVDVIEFCLESSEELLDLWGETLSHILNLALSRGDEALILRLLEKGASVDWRSPVPLNLPSHLLDVLFEHASNVENINIADVICRGNGLLLERLPTQKILDWLTSNEDGLDSISKYSSSLYNFLFKTHKIVPSFDIAAYLNQAVLSQDVSFVETLLNRHLEDCFTTLGPHTRMEVHAFIMLLQTGRETGKEEEAKNLLLHHYGPKSVEIMELIESKGNIFEYRAEPIPEEKIRLVLELELPFVPFYLSCFPSLEFGLVRSLAERRTPELLVHRAFHQYYSVTHQHPVKAFLHGMYNLDDLPVLEPLLRGSETLEGETIVSFHVSRRDFRGFRPFPLRKGAAFPEPGISETAYRVIFAHSQVPDIIATKKEQIPELFERSFAWPNLKLLEIMTEYGADVNIQIPEYGDLLALAVYEGSHSFVRFLLDAGADPTLCMALLPDAVCSPPRTPYEASLSRWDRHVPMLIEKALQKKGKKSKERKL